MVNILLNFYMNFNPFNKKETFWELFLYNLKLLILWVTVVMIWRWVWNLLDRYFFPEDFLLSNILTILIWIAIIFIMEYDLETLWVWDE